MSSNVNSSTSDIWGSVKGTLKKARIRIGTLNGSGDCAERVATSSPHLKAPENRWPATGLEARTRRLEISAKFDSSPSVFTDSLPRGMGSPHSCQRAREECDKVGEPSALAPIEPKLLGPTLSELQQMSSVVLTAYMLEKTKDKGVRQPDVNLEPEGLKQRVESAQQVLVRVYLSSTTSTVQRFAANATLGEVKSQIFQRASIEPKTIDVCAIFEDLDEGTLLLSDGLDSLPWRSLSSVAHLRVVPKNSFVDNAASIELRARKSTINSRIEALVASSTGAAVSFTGEHSPSCASDAPTAAASKVSTFTDTKFAELTTTTSFKAPRSVVDPSLIASPRRESLAATNSHSSQDEQECALFRAKAEEWGYLDVLSYSGSKCALAKKSTGKDTLFFFLSAPSSLRRIKPSNCCCLCRSNKTDAKTCRGDTLKRDLQTFKRARAARIRGKKKERGKRTSHH